MHYNRTTILGAVDRQAVIGQVSQSGDTPVNFSVVIESLNPQTGQVSKSFVSVTYWIRAGQRPPFDPAQLVQGALVFVEGKCYPELYQKNDGTTGAVNKLTASSVGIPHTVMPQQQQQPPAQQYQQPVPQQQPAYAQPAPAQQPPYVAPQPQQGYAQPAAPVQQPAYQQPAAAPQGYQQQAPPPQNPYTAQPPAQQYQQPAAGVPENPLAGGRPAPF